MPGLQGKFDHSAVDVSGKRLFVAATGNKTVEVLDLESGKRISRIPGLQKAQGIYYAPDVNVLLVTDGIGVVAKMYAGDTLQPLHTVTLSADADYVTYVAGTKRFFLAMAAMMRGTTTARLQSSTPKRARSAAAYAPPVTPRP